MKRNPNRIMKRNQNQVHTRSMGDIPAHIDENDNRDDSNDAAVSTASNLPPNLDFQAFFQQMSAVQEQTFKKMQQQMFKKMQEQMQAQLQTQVAQLREEFAQRSPTPVFQSNSGTSNQHMRPQVHPESESVSQPQTQLRSEAAPLKGTDPSLPSTVFGYLPNGSSYISLPSCPLSGTLVTSSYVNTASGGNPLLNTSFSNNFLNSHLMGTSPSPVYVQYPTTMPSLSSSVGTSVPLPTVSSHFMSNPVSSRPVNVQSLSLNQPFDINTILQACPRFTGDNSCSPTKFINTFNKVTRGLSNANKVTLFQCLVQVENTIWDRGLGPNDPVESYQECFLKAFWSRELQELELRKFEETRFTYSNSDQFLEQLDHWYNRLATLNQLNLRTADIINKMIIKMPYHKRDHLYLIDFANFTEFKRKVARIVRKSDFENNPTPGKRAINPHNIANYSVCNANDQEHSPTDEKTNNQTPQSNRRWPKGRPNRQNNNQGNRSAQNNNATRSTDNRRDRHGDVINTHGRANNNNNNSNNNSNSENHRNQANAPFTQSECLREQTPMQMTANNRTFTRSSEN